MKGHIEMKYKIDMQKEDTNEIVKTVHFDAENNEKAVNEYNHIADTLNHQNKGLYFTLSDSEDKTILTSNKAISKYININEMAYKYMPFQIGLPTAKETPSIYIAVDSVPLSEGINRLAEKMADVADVCFIVSSTKENIKQNFDYIRENIPSVKAENILFVADKEKDKTKYVKNHHRNKDDIKTESHAEISILLSSSEKDLNDWSEKGGTAIQLVDERHLRTRGHFVDVNLERAYSSEQRKESIINNACIGVLTEYDNLTEKVISDKDLDVKYEPVVKGQFVPCNSPLDKDDTENELLIDGEEEELEEDFCMEM